VSSLSTGVAAVARAAPPPEGTPPPLRVRPTPAPPEHRFGAVETRPLWERGVERPTPQQKAEAALDRGTGRIVDEPTYELDRMRVEQLEREGTLPPGSTYDLEHDRQERLEAQRLKGAAEGDRERRTEREAQSLAEVRRRWESVLRREDLAGAAVVDRQALERAQQDYLAALRAAAQERDRQLTGIDADRSLTPAQRQARRGAAFGAYEKAVGAAREARESRRAVILGWPEKK
jgi:hypothetical protein